jgi:hypothetical protein
MDLTARGEAHDCGVCDNFLILVAMIGFYGPVMKMHWQNISGVLISILVSVPDAILKYECSISPHVDEEKELHIVTLNVCFLGQGQT